MIPHLKNYIKNLKIFTKRFDILIIIYYIKINKNKKYEN